jgi:hypothetical protein
MSIDDVGGSSCWRMHNKPSNMFDMPLFGKLRDWHNEYGAKFTMYVFAMIDNFNISENLESYAHELSENNNWLRFGYHGNRGLAFSSETDYQEGFELVKSTLSKFGAGTTDILRLHSWLATSAQKEFLRAEGKVRTLLYPDDDSFGYDAADLFIDCGLLHRRTNIWFEKMEAINEETLVIGRPYICAFTHEWCFEAMADRIERSLRIFRKNGYEFI